MGYKSLTLEVLVRSIILALAVLFSFSAQARIEALFHPHDPTLEKIAQWITEADKNIDIAMYNMETGSESPIIQALQSSDVQKRIQNGQLKARMILELYGSPEQNQRKRGEIEKLGVDVRYLDRNVKVHHKFAVIDAHGPLDRVITGSANWSLSSYQNYNENILFFTQEPEASTRYQTEFNRLWNASKEFGFTGSFPQTEPIQTVDQEGLAIYFNTPRHLRKDTDEESHLTSQVVNLINSAQSSLQIASTRIRLVPILEAIKAAADRGVKVEAIISQDDYSDLAKRSQYLLNHPNIDLRVKFYSLRVRDYMTYQMHNKFMIVDDNRMVTGSFNWSFSSENKHIENIVILSGAMAQEVLPSYKNEFNQIFSMGRQDLPKLVTELESGKHEGCGIPQMALYTTEIRTLLSLRTAACK